MVIHTSDSKCFSVKHLQHKNSTQLPKIRHDPIFKQPYETINKSSTLTTLSLNSIAQKSNSISRFFIPEFRKQNP